MSLECSRRSFVAGGSTASSRRSSSNSLRPLAKAPRGQGGQATVELALCLPLVAVLIAVALEFAALGLDRSRLWQAARESARVAAVDPDPDAVQEVLDAAGLGDADFVITPDVSARVQGEPIEVELEFQPTGSVPLIGDLFEGVVLKASASMRLEKP